MQAIVKFAALGTVLFSLSACSKLGLGGHDEMAWARQALERNSRVDIVASDDQAKTFTVRVKNSGQLVVLPVDQIVAGPAVALEAPDAPPTQAAIAPPAAEAPAQPPASPANTTPQPPAPAAPAPSPTPAEAPDSPALASSGEPASPAGAQAPASEDAGGYGEAARGTDVKGPHAQSAANARPGSVLASGPGYSIKATGSKAAPRLSRVTAPGGTPERLHDPIICQGSRLLHIDNRNLEFDGDAITAEDGCDIHITSTHISAKGIGVLARAASVHIKNSEIDGDSGAIDASDGAQVYAESSRFKGLTRRLESSAFHDLGGNVWN